MNLRPDDGTPPLGRRLRKLVLTGASIGLCLGVVLISTWNPQFWAERWGAGLLAGAAAVTYVILRWTNWLRGLVQLAVFLFAEVLFLCSGGLCGQCPLSFGVCPAGTLQRLAFMPEFPWYWTLAAVVATGAVLGTFVCGWLCPLGFVQDLVHSLKLRQVALPRHTTQVRWLVLAGAVILIPMELQWRLLSRWGLWVFSEPTIVLFVMVLLLALLFARPFCRTLCPFGLVYGLLNRVSPVKVRLSTAGCRNCGRCESGCASGLRPGTEVNGTQCCKCGDCKVMSRRQACLKNAAA